MTRLPPKEWQIQFRPTYIAVAAHLNGGGLYWTKLLPSDFPQDRICFADLEGIFMAATDLAAVRDPLLNK